MLTEFSLLSRYFCQGLLKKVNVQLAGDNNYVLNFQ